MNPRYNTNPLRTIGFKYKLVSGYLVGYLINIIMQVIKIFLTMFVFFTGVNFILITKIQNNPCKESGKLRRRVNITKGSSLEKKAIRWHQISSQYNGNRWKTAQCKLCVYENDIKKADIVFAHPHKTKIKRYFQDQFWVSQFWESEGIYPDINSEKFNASISYRQDAMFHSYAMITDTFKMDKIITPLPYEQKIKIEWVSVWLSNCGFKERNNLLKKLQDDGITTASYGRCKHDHSESEMHFSSEQVDKLDEDRSPGSQKIAHSSNHLFLFAAENNISPYYHTEKLYHGLMAGSVPIYYGDDTIDEFVPKHSIIKASDYGTSLSDYLKLVAENKELYESYFAWRKKPLPNYLKSKLEYKSMNTCQICEKLYNGITLKAVPNHEFVQKHTVFRKTPIKKNLIFITTHMSRYHQIYLKECWVKLLKKRKIIKDADIMIFTTETPQWLHEIFPTAIIKKYKNPGYQEGANLALQKLMKYKWYDGYEWVIRLNPDVIIKSDDWLLKTMQNPKIHGIFDDCKDTGCKTSYCTSNLVHTDFFAVRASQMNENMFNNTIHQNSEKLATKEFSEIIRLGHDAWIPRTTFYKGQCRIVSDIIIHDDDVSKCLK